MFQSKSSFDCYGTDGKSEPKQVKLWERSRPIPPGGIDPAKEHCRFNLSFVVCEDYDMDLAGRGGSLHFMALILVPFCLLRLLVRD